MRTTNPEKTNYWLRQVQALQESGLSRKVFCERNQVKLSTLGYWCRKLSAAAGEDNRVGKCGWIPLQIHDDEPAGINLKVGRITITVKPGFDPSLLVVVLRTINAC
jgi:hypothetical protein